MRYYENKSYLAPFFFFSRLLRKLIKSSRSLMSMTFPMHLCWWESGTQTQPTNTHKLFSLNFPLAVTCFQWRELSQGCCRTLKSLPRWKISLRIFFYRLLFWREISFLTKAKHYHFILWNEVVRTCENKLVNM